ncbi:uncharacterized protein LOC128682016 [Plodia interpunctella]|uniref:uncharacterized protein LOC128682016 n=1 Tax=Plodia interpunctella TaxID=58824 RepID=UPI002367F2B5|nr:uncharacterized protein LOC128682016 [Plodia interpunctella]
MNNCNGCLNEITGEKYLRCKDCNSCFHHICLNIRDEQFLSLSATYKTSWTCPSCCNVSHRRKNNNTPVRKHQLPIDDSHMNMSFDVQDNSTTSIATTEPGPCCSGCNGGVTMEKISALLDEKLKTTLASSMNDFRLVLKEDVKSMVRAEMGGMIQEIKDDLNVATDFFNSEQETLKTRIANKEASIKTLEADCERLHADLRYLSTKVSALDKSARSYNIEIQAVPENRNENVSSLFKKLSEVVGCPISDSCIQACRRVAKMDSSSRRPRNILVTLSSPKLKDSVISAVRRFNKTNPKDTLSSRHLGITVASQKIYVVEHLSPECKQLFAAARRFAKDNQYKYAWTKFGRVYVRKSDITSGIYIKDLDTLNNLV